MSYPTNFPAIFPSLMLDFANTKQLDPRITFTRASTATFYDEETTVKGDENLIPNSVGFGSFSAGANVTAASNINGPDGTASARRLTYNGISDYNIGYANNETTQNYTFSVWIRRISGTGDIRITAGAGVYATQSITTSWARYSVTQSMTLGTGQIAGIRCEGVGITIIEVWGPQLERRSAVHAYTPTTGLAIVRYIPRLMTAATNVARFTHDPITRESLGLLIEEQRANLVPYSEDFGDASWTKNAATVTTNAVIAPDGTQTGDKLVETATTSVHRVSRTISISPGVTHTLSVYAKAAERNILRLYASSTAQNGAVVNLSNGSLVSTEGGPSVRIIDVGGGWYRILMTFSPIGSSTSVEFNTATATTSTILGDAFSGLYLWGAQLEAGAFATSYIPTVAASVTRSADTAVMTGVNFTSWYRADEGTMYSEANCFRPVSAGNSVFGISDGSSNNRHTLYVTLSLLAAGGECVVNNSTQADMSVSQVAGGIRFFKQAYAYKTNNFAFSANASTVGTDTSGLLPIVNEASFGSTSSTSEATLRLNGTIKKIAYYPSRLTNAQLQGLTT